MNTKNTHKEKSLFARLGDVELINTLEMLHESANHPEQDSQSRVAYRSLLEDALMVARLRPDLIRAIEAAAQIDSDPGIKSLFSMLIQTSPTPHQPAENSLLKFGKRIPDPSRGGETQGEKDSFYEKKSLRNRAAFYEILSRGHADTIKKLNRRGSAQFFNGVIAASIFFISGACLIWILNGGF